MSGATWINEELDYLKNNFESKSCSEIAEHLGRTTRSVQHKFGQLGLERKQPEVGDTVPGTRLTILRKYMKPVGKQNKTFVWVRCNCADKTEFEVLLSNVVQKVSRSCGCLKSEIQRERAIARNYKHGQAVGNCSHLYRKWVRMRWNTGKEVYKAWEDFLLFEKWSKENGYEDGFHIYLLDEDGIYEPCNCIWHPMGIADERLYKTWSDMLIRCYNPNFKQYHNYGGRGISVCDQWRKRYFIFKDWAINNGYQEDLTIERKQVNGNYEPDNCTWIPLSEQGKNRTNTK